MDKIATKKCSKCGEIKSISEFGIHPGCKLGVNSRCKECAKKYHKKHYTENKIQYVERDNRYRQLNLNNNPNTPIEKKCKICLTIKPSNEFAKDSTHFDGLRNICKVCRADKMKKHRVNNSDYAAYRKKYDLLNAKKRRNYEKNRMQNDIDFKIKKTIKGLFYKNLKTAIIKKKYSLFSYTGIAFNDYISHFSKDPLWEKYISGEALHIDHIIPVSAYDHFDDEEIKKCWHPENLRLLDPKENISKYNKIDFNLIKKYNIKHLTPKNLITKEG